MSRNRRHFIDAALNAMRKPGQMSNGAIATRGDFSFVRHGSRILVLYRVNQRFIQLSTELGESAAPFLVSMRQPLRLARVFAVLDFSNEEIQVVACGGTGRSLALFNRRVMPRHMHVVTFPAEELPHVAA